MMVFGSFTLHACHQNNWSIIAIEKHCLPSPLQGPQHPVRLDTGKFRIQEQSGRAIRALAGRRLLKASSERLEEAFMATKAGSEKTGVLFVCLGNICRSPTAEAVFKAVVDRRQLSGAYDIDSCGTGGGIENWYKKGGYSYHEGGPADERMAAAAAKRGINLTSLSRPLRPDDLVRFDYILAMDFENKAAVELATDHWAGEGYPIPPKYRDKVSLMCTHNRAKKFEGFQEVPDPYWSDDERGFNQVLDLLEDSCEGLLDSIEAKRKSSS